MQKGTADDNYELVSSFNPEYNQYDIYDYSGVWDTLSNLPLYNDYVPQGAE
jgi:hypothetical protein